MRLSSRFRKGPAFMVLLFTLLLIGAAWYRLIKSASPLPISGTRVFPARILPQQEFLPASADSPVTTLNDLRGKWLIMFFGYTSCPDVCPTTMRYLQEEYAGLLENRDAATVVMISIDPANDTPIKVAEYAKFYEPRFIGLVAKDLQTLSKELGLTVQAATAQTTLQHSGDLFIINPSGKWTALYRPPFVKGALSKDLRNMILAGE